MTSTDTPKAAEEIDQLIERVIRTDRDCQGCSRRDYAEFDDARVSARNELEAAIDALSANAPVGEVIGYVSPATLKALNEPNGAGAIVAAAGYDTLIPVYAAPPGSTPAGWQWRSHIGDFQWSRWRPIDDEALTIGEFRKAYVTMEDERWFRKKLHSR